MSNERDRFDLLVAMVPEPPPVERLRQRARRRHHQRRAAQALAVTLIGAAAVAIPLAVHDSGARDQKVVFTSTPGSAGMPSTFVAADLKGNVDLLDSNSGTVIRHVYTDSHFVEAIASNAHDVFLSDQTGIYEVPLGGGAARCISTDNATDLAMSPDGTRLAWGVAVNSSYSGRADTTFSGVRVFVMDLASGTSRGWPLQVLTPHDVQFDQLDSLGWASNTEAAAVTAPNAVGTNAVECPAGLEPRASPPIAARLVPPDALAIPPGCEATRLPATVPPAALPDQARLFLIDTTSRLGPRSLEFDGDSQSIVEGSGANFLAGANKPGTLITAIQRFEGGTSPATRLVELKVTGDQVNVTTIANLPSDDYPQSLDSDGQDLLFVTEIGSNPYTFSILRSTDNGSSVKIVAAGPWFVATW